MKRSPHSLFGALLLVLLSSCGGDEEVLLSLQSGPCLVVGTAFGSLKVVIIAGPPNPGDLPIVLKDNCYPLTQHYPATPEGIKIAFAKLGYVAKDIKTDKAITVAIRLYPDTRTCNLPHSPCLISNLIPPEGAKTNIELLTTCDERIVSPLRKACLDLTEFR